MASIKNLNNDSITYLLPHHTFGRRQSAVDTWVNYQEVSNLHCIVQWQGGHWEIRDTSRNGLWIDGTLAEKEKPSRLQTGMRVSLTPNNSHTFQVLDAAAPEYLLIPENKTLNPIPLEPYNLLPDSKTPELCIFQHTQENNMLWQMQWLEDAPDDDAQPLHHGDVLHIGKVFWQAFLPQLNQQTRELDGRNGHTLLSIEFNVSLDQESVEILLTNSQHTQSLGYKVQHYLLLHLARQRIEDSARHLPEKDQGWIANELLEKQLGLDATYINIQVFRLRQAFSQITENSNSTKSIVERRRGCTRIGISADNIRII